MWIFTKEKEKIKIITYDEIKKKLRHSKDKEVSFTNAKVSSETEVKLNLDGYVVIPLHSHEGEILIRKAQK